MLLDFAFKISEIFNLLVIYFLDTILVTFRKIMDTSLTVDNPLAVVDQQAYLGRILVNPCLFVNFIEFVQ